MALAADRPLNIKSGSGATKRLGRRGVAAGVVIFLGALIGKNAAGHIVPASDAASIKIIGFSEQNVDNTAGAAAALKCSYVTGVEAELDNAGGAIVLANLGRGCYVASDAGVTTAAVSVHKVFVGTVQEFTAAKVWVMVDEQIIGVLGEGNVANVAPTGLGQGGIAMFEIADAASADYDIVVPEKIEALDALVQKTAAAAGVFANTVQVKSTAAVISDAMSINNAADGALVRATNITDANSLIAAGGILRVSVVKAGGNAAVKVAIPYVKRA